MHKINVNFSQLVTQSINESTSYLITRIPNWFLKPVELEILEFVRMCNKSGFIPTLERMKEQLNFIPQPIEVPAQTAYMAFMSNRRDELIATEINEYAHKNGVENIYSLLETLKNKYAILQPDVLDYSEVNRDELLKTVYRSKYYIPYMDEWTNGLQSGDLITVLGGTKCYKTTWLKDALLGAVLAGENCLFVSQEQSPKKMVLQFDATMTGLSHSVFRGELNDFIYNKIKKAEKKSKGDIGKLLITPRIADVTALREYVASVPFKIHKIMIDGYNLMTGGSSDGYSSVAQNMADLKPFLEDKEIISIGVTQKNRSGNSGKTSGEVADVGSSIAIALYSDAMINMKPINTQLPNQPIDFYVYMNPVLNRHGPTNPKMAYLPIYEGDRYYTRYIKFHPDYDPDGANEMGLIAGQQLTALTKELSTSDKDIEAMVMNKLGISATDAINNFGVEEVKDMLVNEF